MADSVYSVKWCSMHYAWEVLRREARPGTGVEVVGSYASEQIARDYAALLEARHGR